MEVGYKGRCSPKQQAPLIVSLLLSAKEMTSFPFYGPSSIARSEHASVTSTGVLNRSVLAAALGEQIRERRAARGLPQGQHGEKCDLYRAFIGSVE